jgi:hypothetical protein
MMLAQGRWPGAVEALLDALEREEARGNHGSRLWRSLRLDVYRVLGAEAHGLTVPEMRGLWLKRGGGPGRRPFTHRESLVNHRRTTYFAEAALGSSVFALDVSSSMRVEPRGAHPVSKASAEAVSRITWANHFLLRALGRLPEATRFGLVAFHDRPIAFRRELRPASLEEKRAAAGFVKGVTPRGGTDLLAGLYAALAYPGVEAIVALTDGGDPMLGVDARLEARLLAWNYLRGARIVVYHMSSHPPEEDDPLHVLERIAYQHFGWYRPIRWEDP